MKLLILMLMLFSFSNAGGIDSLLHDYEQDSELSKKTKDENAGNLIIYTRDDLERMQVESLKDILKSLRLFAYTENRMGQPDILNQDPLNYYSSSVRVYLNEAELVTGITGSGIILFGDMEMDFIDHVEIYHGFPSFDFGVEPATVVIHLYSKTAEHDEGGRVKATVTTDGANKQNIYYADSTDELSYFFYANTTDDKKDTYAYDGETLKRDSKTNRFYASLSTENHTVNFHAMKSKGDAFIGPLLGNVPQSTSRENSYINIATNSKFIDNSLILDFSYTKLNTEYLSEYDPVKNYVIVDSTPSFINSYNQLLDEEVFTASLKKEFELGSHMLTLGTQCRYKTFDMSERYIDDVLNNPNQHYDTENIYSLFLQDLITLNANNLLSISVMDQEFLRNSDVNNQNTLQLRLGYIYTDKKFVTKTFLSLQDFATEPYLLMKNPELHKTTYTSALQEFSYETKQTQSKIVLGYGISENMVILDENTLALKNSSLDLGLYTAMMEFVYNFSQKDKLELQANYWYLESPFDDSDGETEHMSYVMRMLNSVSSFDIFNELVIHTGYTGVDNGYDYSAGIKYQVNKDFHINMKGENLFDSALDADYHVMKGTFPTISSDTIIIPVVERRFTLGMEYLF